MQKCFNRVAGELKSSDFRTIRTLQPFESWTPDFVKRAAVQGALARCADLSSCWNGQLLAGSLTVLAFTCNAGYPRKFVNKVLVDWCMDHRRKLDPAIACIIEKQKSREMIVDLVRWVWDCIGSTDHLELESSDFACFNSKGTMLPLP
jgi:hypothetical protein